MSSEIGYGYQAIKAGEVKYQQAMVDLVKKSAEKPEQKSEAAQSKPAAHVGKNVDVKA
jgi:hypothetical protein